MIHEKEKGKLLSLEGGGLDRRAWKKSKENIKIQERGETGNLGLFKGMEVNTMEPLFG